MSNGKEPASRPRSVRVEALARVEGEGGISVKIRGGKVTESLVRIFEPPRFFEGFLRGRQFSEAPDITARICGICPVAYQMSAVHALEAACAAEVTPAIRALRRLLYCGEWIESHVLHVAMLHAPDFLGYPSALHMAKDHPEIVAKSLALKKAGNAIVTAVGGREIHPVNVRVGGFYRAPSRSELGPLVPPLQEGRKSARELLDLAAGFTFPDFAVGHEFVALRHQADYPLAEGRLVSSGGLDLPASEYESRFAEEQVPHSNALHSRLKGRGHYLVGPLARYSLNFDRLPGAIQELALGAGLEPVCRNPFQSILVRVVETLWAIDEALAILASYVPPEPSFVPVSPRAATGCALTEAPRGILYHRYRIAADGTIEDAKIVPPTSQNLGTIEDDLRAFVERRLDLPAETLTWQCEQAVRNYDPCISCATHFLKVTVDRS
jgi:coenzyme F420-reducing hydrogenase alpha subunit